MGLPAVLVTVLMGMTVPCPLRSWPATYTVAPSGAIARAQLPLPTGTGLPVLPLAALIGVTVPLEQLATYRVLPSGVMTMASGSTPTVIGLPATPVAVLIGTTVPSMTPLLLSLALTAYRVLPSGATTRACGQNPALAKSTAIL